MVTSGVRYNSFECVHDDVVFVVERNSHSYDDPSRWCGAAATES